MAVKPNAIPSEKLALYEQAVATLENVERKGKNSPYTSVNGHMFSYLSRDGVMGLRLPKVAREQFLTEHSTQLFEQYGAVMKEYVTVPDRLLADTAALATYFQVSYDYVSGLKPKPTKRKK